MKSYTEKDRLERKRSETKQLVIGREKRDRSLDWRIVARPESKCGERKGGMGVGRRMAIQTGAGKHAEGRTMPRSWLWSEVE